MPAALSSTSPAGAQSIQSLRAQATSLASGIQTDYDKLEVLDEGYNRAHQEVQKLDSQIKSANVAISKQATRLQSDRMRLRTVAIDAYIAGDSTPGIAVLMTGDAKSLPMQQVYLNAASGNLGQAEAAVTSASHVLTVKRTNLTHTEHAAATTEHKIANERALAEQITAQLETDLSSVKGRLAEAVAAAEREKQLQAEAAAEAAALAKQQQINTPPPSTAPSPPSTPPPPVAGGGSGAVAVRAAESQLGVPYVWGGATPGVGFDCSGLTMWSWGQAGVGLDHGATDQYYEIAHVSMSNLQPGDLIFYGDSSYLYHVVMYVGSGPYGSSTVIQAQNTGTNVMFTPIPPGAYGAGQP